MAIVRFRPSVIDPHSDYADELYYPPGKEVLLPFRPIDVDTQEASEAIDEAIADTILQVSSVLMKTLIFKPKKVSFLHP